MKKGAVIPGKEFGFPSIGHSKVDFVMTFVVEEMNLELFSGHFEITAEINSFVEMMVQRPLTNFVNLLAENLVSKILV